MSWRVTKTIKLVPDTGGRFLTYKGGVSATTSNHRPGRERPPYKVTYTLDPKGKYLVVFGGVIENMRTKKQYPVCFLPDLWYNQRVSRKVVLL